jgi:hypothetical protein
MCGGMINVYNILIGKPEGRDHLGDIDLDGKNIKMNI